MIPNIGMLILAYLAGKQLNSQESQQVEEWYASRIGGTSSGAIQGQAALTGDVQSIAYGDRVYIDASAAGGTAYPYGTRKYPCKTLAQARTICTAYGLNKIMVIGAWTLDADMAGYIFEGVSADAAINLGGLSANNSVFINLIGAYGTAHAATVDNILTFNCRGVAPITNPINILAFDSILSGNIHLNTTLVLENCTAEGAIFDFDAADANCTAGLYDFHGAAEIHAMAQATHLLYASGDGVLTINANNTAGTITTRGGIATVGAGGGVTITATYSEIASLITALAQLGRVRCIHAPQWGALTEEIQLTDGATDTALPQIVVSKLPAGATPTCVRLGVKFGAVENTAAGVNKFSGAQYVQIKKGAGAWNNAILIPDDYMALAAATREGGDVIIGDIDLAAVVTGNDTYAIQIHDALVDADFMLLNNVQTFLHIEYSI